MSHFYGVLVDNRGEAARCATKSSGLTTKAAGWDGAIFVHLDHRDGRDYFVVKQSPWHGSGCSGVLAQGKLGYPAPTLADQAMERDMLTATRELLRRGLESGVFDDAPEYRADVQRILNK